MANFLDLTIEECRRGEQAPTYRVMDEPVLLFDRFEIREVAVALGTLILLGVIAGLWLLAAMCVVATLWGLPQLRTRFPRGSLSRVCHERTSKLPIGPFTWGRTKTISGAKGGI